VEFRFSIVRNFLHSHIHECIVIVQMKSNYQHLCLFFELKKIISTSSLIRNLIFRIHEVRENPDGRKSESI
jgi:hypothetical protein